MGEEAKKIRPKKTIDQIEKEAKENYKKIMAKVKTKRLNDLNKKLVAENKQLNENISKLNDNEKLKTENEKLKADYERLKRFEKYSNDDWWFNLLSWFDNDLRDLQVKNGFSDTLYGGRIKDILIKNLKLIAEKEKK